MQGTTRVWWETWWPTPQCLALQPLWWCGETVSIHSPPPLPPGYLAHQTDTVGERASLGDKSLVLSVTLFFFWAFGFCLREVFIFCAVPKPLDHTGLYIRETLCLCMKTHIYITRTVVCAEKNACRHTNTARSLPHILNHIRTVYMRHFRFELRQNQQWTHSLCQCHPCRELHETACQCFVFWLMWLAFTLHTAVMGEYEPKIEVQFPDTLHVPKGSSVKLECFALGK